MQSCGGETCEPQVGVRTERTPVDLTTCVAAKRRSPCASAVSRKGATRYEIKKPKLAEIAVENALPNFHVFWKNKNHTLES